MAYPLTAAISAQQITPSPATRTSSQPTAPSVIAASPMTTAMANTALSGRLSRPSSRRCAAAQSGLSRSCSGGVGRRGGGPGSGCGVAYWYPASGAWQHHPRRASLGGNALTPLECQSGTYLQAVWKQADAPPGTEPRQGKPWCAGRFMPGPDRDPARDTSRLESLQGGGGCQAPSHACRVRRPGVAGELGYRACTSTRADEPPGSSPPGGIRRRAADITAPADRVGCAPGPALTRRCRPAKPPRP